MHGYYSGAGRLGERGRAAAEPPLPTFITRQADNQVRVYRFKDASLEFFLDVMGAQRIK